MEVRARLSLAHLFPAVLSMLVGTTWWSALAQTSERQPLLYHFDAAMVDRSADPCVDFHKFACGKWTATNSIPAGESFWNTRSDLQLWNWMVVRRAMERAARTQPNRNPIEQKIGDYWFACMDEKHIEARGMQPINGELKFIASLNDKRQLAQAVARYCTWNFQESR